MKKQPLCPCNSGDLYASCCEPIINGELAGSAEQLMRSRYTAFTQNNEAYLLRSWHQSTRPQILNLADDKHIKWVDLKIIMHESEETSAIVEFVARFKVNGKADKIHELSRFTREDGRWLYVDGDQY